MNKQLLATIAILLVVGCGIFYMGFKYNDTEPIIIKVHDTLYIQKDGRIDTLWLTETKLETLHTETVVLGDTTFITKIDTVYVTIPQLVAKLDTLCLSKDSLFSSNLSIKYNISTNRFWIRNVLSYTTPYISPIRTRKHLNGLVMVIGNESSLEAVFGASLSISDRVSVLGGYTTEKRIMFGIDYRFF
jgi:hypothetical protein